MTRRLPLTPLLPLLLLTGCSDDGQTETAGPTYYRDAKAIVDARCATCHREGDIGPFPLTTYDEVMAFAGPVRASIENGTMPPWQPSDECNSYLEDIDLTAGEKQTLLAWLDADAPMGDPANASQGSGPGADGFDADVSLKLPDPYTPTLEPDDYRCQLIPWPADETRFVTGVKVTPDQGAIVHHTIVFMVGPDQVDQFVAYDEAEDGPGYTCYGGPRASDAGGFGNVDPAALLAALDKLGIDPADLQAGNVTEEQLAALIEELGGGTAGGFQSLGAWVPGAPSTPFPAGTGIRVEPGSMLVVQMHYNTLTSAPVADQSTIEIATTDSVEREATTLPVLDLGWVSDGLIGEPMTIPAGESNVEHATTVGFGSFLLNGPRQVLGLSDDEPLVLHTATHHMHELGKRQHSELRRADGSKSCLLDIPDWDFSWQGRYTMTAPITFRPGDELWMGCTWDNSAANQPVVDGEIREPADVAWGEGTSDEMCLGAFYVTAE